MKLIILKEKLKEGINVVERITQKSLILPILNNILIKAEKNFLSLVSTNLEIGLRWWSLAKIEKEGEIIIPTRLLSNLLNFLPEGPLELETEGLYLNIKSKNYESHIKGFNPEEFPIFPQINQEEKINFSCQVFCQALSQVFDITSPSLVRPEISGVFLQFQKEQTKIVATDSFRLGEKKIFLELPLTKEYSFILPQLTAREVINVFGEKEGDFKIYFSPNQVLFELMLTETNHPHIHLISRLIEGDFPDYQIIIPKKYETQFTLLKNEFLNHIKSASLFSGKINEIKLNILPSKGRVEILSQNPDLGEYKSSLPAKIEGKALSISFNHRFLIEGLFKIKSLEVIFELTDKEGPVVLKPIGLEDYLYIVMPIKSS